MTPDLWAKLLVGILGGAVGGTASQLIAGYYKRQGDDRQLAASKEQFGQLQQRWEGRAGVWSARRSWLMTDASLTISSARYPDG